MNKELEEAIKKSLSKKERGTCVISAEILETVLNYIDNSISKEVIEEYLRQEQEAFNTYKKESKENEKLKIGMWKHLGAKNMCERILGIERNIVTLD